MRIQTALGVIVVALAVPAGAHAQTPPVPRPTTEIPMLIPSSSINWVDFGVRGTTDTGEASRYERYRDLGNGASLNTFNLQRQKNDWFFSGWGFDVGRRDQRIVGTVERPGRLKLWGMFDQIPMLMSRVTQTMFVENIGSSPSVLTIPDAVQTQMQTTPTTGNGRVAVFDANRFTFTTDSKRSTGAGGFEYLATPALTFRTLVANTQRDGTLPYGGSFGHSSMVEMPAPIRHSLTDLDTYAEFVRGRMLLKGGFIGSWFHNDVTQVEFDNPFQATDLANTPSRGRLSLAPSNSYVNANGMATFSMPARTRATAYVSVGSLSDDGAPLMPQTINSVNQPLIAALPRTTVDGHARTTGVNLTFTSRPVKFADFSARYRLYDYDNRTPEFVLPQRVAYDNTPAAATFSTLGGGLSPAIVESEPFGVKRQTFEADVRMKPGRFGAAGIGYTRHAEDRSHRFFESTGEDVIRVTYDLFDMQTFSVRSRYEHGARRADVTEDARMDLFNIGEQPDMRHYDIAQRDRDRVTIVGTVTPLSRFTFNGSLGVGRDDYFESTFGLRDNKHQVYTGGVDAVPTDNVSFGLSYAFERYDSIQHSRQVASPPSGANVLTYPQFIAMSSSPGATQAVADPRFDWSADGADRVHSIIGSLDIFKIKNRLDLRFVYDYNRARALYSYDVGSTIPLRTLPEDIDPTLTALPPPTALPLVRSKTQRGTFDAVYTLTPRLGLGFAYWYEDYSVTDFQLDIDSTPDLVRGNSLLLGYLYRPYTAQTGWARLIVHW